MKKYLVLGIAFFLAFFVFLESAGAAYNWQPAGELTASDYALLFSAGVDKISSPIAQFARAGNTLIILQLQNGETVMAGAGKKQFEKSRSKQETTQAPNDNSQSYAYKKINADPLLEQLTSLGRYFYGLLDEMSKKNEYDYSDTDKLFPEMTALIEKIDWDSEAEKGGSLSNFRMAFRYGKRYGIPGTKVLSRALDRFPTNNYLKNSFEDAFGYAIISSSAPETERPNAEEIALLAQKLLSFYESYDLIPSRYIEIINPLLRLAAPKTLQKIEVLTRERIVAKEK